MHADYVAGPWKDTYWPHGPDQWECVYEMNPEHWQPDLMQAVFAFLCTIPVIKNHHPFMGTAPALDFEHRNGNLFPAYPRKHGVFVYSRVFDFPTSVDNTRQAIADFLSGWHACEKARQIGPRKEPVKKGTRKTRKINPADG